MNNNPTNILCHARTMVIEQIMALEGRGHPNPRAFRTALESESPVQLAHRLELLTTFPASQETTDDIPSALRRTGASTPSRGKFLNAEKGQQPMPAAGESPAAALRHSEAQKTAGVGNKINQPIRPSDLCASETLPVGTCIRFTKTLTAAADEDHPELIYCTKGELGEITGNHLAQGYAARVYTWPNSFWVYEDEFEVFTPQLSTPELLNSAQ